ncbi:MAG: hypothetical protein ABGY71_09535 [bacterium]|nr:hypothetical protein [Planctomycetota bacterium]HIL53165.1 hypothetical protein [Planctomycetota bacterium]
MKTALLGSFAALSLALVLQAAPSLIQKGGPQKGAPSKGAAVPAEPSGVTDAASVIAAQLPSYPGNFCLVHGGLFTAERPVQNLVLNGQLYRVCSDKCASKIQIEAAPHYLRLRKLCIAAQKPLWPLQACPVSGDPYGGEMGRAVDFVVGTRYVKLCCKGCTRNIRRDPVQFFAALDDMLLPALRKTYPSKVCPISSEELGGMGDPVEFMYGHRLVRLCCKMCKKGFDENPLEHMRTLYPRKKGTKPAAKKPEEKAPKK